MSVGCTHGYICITCMCVCLSTPCQKSTIPGEPATFFLNLFLFVCFKMESFTGTWSPLGRLGWVAREFQESPDSVSSILELQECPIIPDFLHGCWGSNSSPHAYIPTELSSHQSHAICLLQVILNFHLFIYLGVDDCTCVEVSALAPPTMLELRIKFRSLDLVTRASIHSVYFQPSKLFFVCVFCYLSFHTAFLK